MSLDRGVRPSRVSNPFDGHTGRLCDIERACRIMEERELDGLVLSMTPHVYYFSNYFAKSSTGLHDNAAVAMVVFARRAPEAAVLLIPDTDSATVVQRGTWIDDVRVFGGFIPPLGTPIDAASFHRIVPEWVVERTSWGSAARAGFTGDRTAMLHRAMSDLGLSKGARVGFDVIRSGTTAPVGVQIVDGFGAVRKIRETKTPSEIALLRASARINELALQMAIDAWVPGMTWNELCHEYDVAAVRHGGFPHDPGGVAVANPPGKDPAWYIDPRGPDHVLEPGTNVMFDCHGTFERYAWDGGKTWFVGDEPSNPLMQKVASVTEEALYAVYEALRPGVPVSILQQVGLEPFRSAGLPHADHVNIFFHNLGLDHIDREEGYTPQPALPGGPADFTFEESSVATIHLVYPGSDRERYYLEDCFLTASDHVEKLFTWDARPHSRSETSC